MPDEIPQPVPVITLYIDIIHTTPQARLQILRMPPKQPHYHTPAQACKHRPRVVAHLGTGRLGRHGRQGKRAPLLNRQPSQGEGDAGKDVDNYLLVYARDSARAGTAAKDEVSAHEAGDEAIVRTLFAGVGTVVFQ